VINGELRYDFAATTDYLACLSAFPRFGPAAARRADGAGDDGDDAW